MSKTNNETRDNYRNGKEGLKQRRLKTENRWKFNPKQEYKVEETDEEELEDEEDYN